MLEEWAKRDPIARFRTWLRENVHLSEDEEDEISSEVKQLVEESVQRADASPSPDPDTLLDGVFAEPEELDAPHFR
jgi:pyruvate dehydrogenase E1 component alpha subunit